MSGTDSKAGGPDYLILHMQAKSTSEKSFKNFQILRRGKGADMFCALLSIINK